MTYALDLHNTGMSFGGVQELTLVEIDAVSGAGELGDAIRAVGDVGQKIVDTAYNAGYMLGKAIHDACN